MNKKKSTPRGGLSNSKHEPRTIELFHGTSVGWLEKSHFQPHNRGYSESKVPHNFIYLAANQDGARNAALGSVIHSNARLKAAQLAPEDFQYADTDGAKRAYCIKPYVYRITIENPVEIPWHQDEQDSPALTLAQRASVSLGIFRSEYAEQQKHSLGQKTLAFLNAIWAAAPCFGSKGNWREAVDDCAERVRERIHGRIKDRLPNIEDSIPGTDGRANILGTAGFNLIAGIEADNDGQNYGTTYAMLTRQSNKRPAKYQIELLRPMRNVRFSPVAHINSYNPANFRRFARH